MGLSDYFIPMSAVVKGFDRQKDRAPEALAVYARYTRRGGLDINPFRSSGEFPPPDNTREVRQ